MKMRYITVLTLLCFTMSCVPLDQRFKNDGYTNTSALLQAHDLIEWYKKNDSNYQKFEFKASNSKCDNIQVIEFHQIAGIYFNGYLIEDCNNSNKYSVIKYSNNLEDKNNDVINFSDENNSISNIFNDKFVLNNNQIRWAHPGLVCTVIKRVDGVIVAQLAVVNPSLVNDYNTIRNEDNDTEIIFFNPVYKNDIESINKVNEVLNALKEAYKDNL